MDQTTFTVQGLAQKAGVTVRTLHHYDDIGLLKPAGRSDAGYRLYGQAEVRRLHQICTLRALGLSLAQLKEVLEAPPELKAALLKAQRPRLLAQIQQMTGTLSELEKAIDQLEKENAMSTDKLFEDFDPGVFEDEARDRWGEEDAYKESARRTKGYGKADWAKLKEEADAIMKAVAQALQKGVKPGSQEGKDLAESHRLHIDRWFYPCSKTMHAGLAEMYLADERFKANMDKFGDGVAAFLSKAVKANLES